jgi:hypothetical protein
VEAGTLSGIARGSFLAGNAQPLTAIRVPVRVIAATL